MKKRIFAVLLAIGLSAAAVTGCGSGQSTDSPAGSQTTENEEKTFVFGDTTFNAENGESDLNPHNDNSGWACIRYGVGETLFRFTDNMEIEPWLAESYENIDELTWKITLREGITFTSGRTMDAEAVKECLEGMGYTCEYYAFSDSNDLSSVATTAASESDVIYVPTDNTVAANTEIINNICAPEKIPVIAGEEGICQGCGVATLSINYYDLGVATGKMALKVLVDGEDISTMPIEYAPQFTKEYNPEICKELGIEVPDDYVAIGADAEEESDDSSEEATEGNAAEDDTATETTDEEAAE